MEIFDVLQLKLLGRVLVITGFDALLLWDQRIRLRIDRTLFYRAINILVFEANFGVGGVLGSQFHVEILVIVLDGRIYFGSFVRINLGMNWV